MANYLSNLRAPEGSSSKPLRKGRGVGSGLGKTAGKGMKGQKARHPGNFKKLGFQGGQTPIQRRLPKRGFRNLFAVETAAVNVSSLEKKFESGATVDLVSLVEARLVEAKATRVKILGDGTLSKSLTVKVDAISAGAREKIEKAGGKVELIVVETAASKEAAAK